MRQVLLTSHFLSVVQNVRRVDSSFVYCFFFVYVLGLHMGVQNLHGDEEDKINVALANMDMELRKCTDVNSLVHFHAVEDEQVRWGGGGGTTMAPMRHLWGEGVSVVRYLTGFSDDRRCLVPRKETKRLVQIDVQET